MKTKKTLALLLALSLVLSPATAPLTKVHAEAPAASTTVEKPEEAEATVPAPSTSDKDETAEPKAPEAKSPTAPDEGAPPSAPSGAKNTKAPEKMLINGTIASVHEKYGNATLSIAPKTLLDAGYKYGDMITLKVNDKILDMPFVTNYSDVDHGALALVDATAKDGTHSLIAAINMGNIAKTHGIEANMPVEITLKEAGAYKEEYEIHHLERTNSISDYNNDEAVFANFRVNPTSGLEAGILYRSSSPINNEIARAKYADKLIKAAGVKTVLNLADTPDQIKEYAEKSDFESPYYKSLFDEGSVKPLAMGVDVAGEAFGEKLAEGLRFLIDHDGPYLVHCTEGKDRAGFVSAVLSSLMGASHDEVVRDYMTTYENYYHIEKDSAKYNKIADSNIKMSLTTVMANQPKGTAFASINLAEAAESYLKRIGLNDTEIERLKICLSDQSGTVTKIEKYGHAMSDLLIEDVNKQFTFGDMVTVTFDNGFKLDAPYVDGYFVEKGAYLLRAYPGDDTVAVCINYGKLYEKAGVHVGDRFKIEMKEKGGYADEYLVRNLKRTNNRDDYSSDEVFANFRNIRYGKTAPNRLFRSSSPVNDTLKRNAYADKLMGAAGIRTVVNFADSDEQIKGYLEKTGDQTPNYKALFEGGHVKALNLGLAYQSPEFNAGMIEGLKFMAANEGPYLFHCTEGKDRTGYMGALLNALLGASLNEIVDDYMTSYANFYGVSKAKNAKQYELIKDDVLGMLKHITGTDELQTADLAAKATAYLRANGMSDAEIAQLITNLTEVEAEAPKLISGAGQTWTKGSDKGLLFISSADLNTLKMVKVDGNVLVRDKDYTAVSGSTEVTLSPTLLATLKGGKHLVEIISADGTVSAEFTVIEKAVQPKAAPKTGDEALTFAMCSIILAAGMLIALRKKTPQR